MSTSHLTRTSEESTIPFASGKLSGWGRYPQLLGRAFEPDTMQGLLACLSDAQLYTNSVLARGLGRSYGDAAVSSESRVIHTSKLNRMLRFDSSHGILSCEPGVSFEDLLQVFPSRGWFPPVSPGTKFVTMGGALASDIHGKNHHKDGSFVNFVRSFHVLGPRSEIIRCSREENTELFWATAGGMGLTGIVKEIELSLKAIETPFLHVKKIRCANLEQTFKMIEDSESQHEYSVSWIDGLAGGANLGRSILILGRHLTKADLAASHCAQISTSSKGALTVPFDMPSWMLNRYSIGAFNELYYNFSCSPTEEKIAHYNSFFYPLDFLSDWNRLYGKRGFIQYQCALPLETSKEGLEEILTVSSKRGRSSFLAVLKKFGKGNGLLSFPIPGYTLTLDMPVNDGLFEFTKELDAIVLKYGGRVYLAKDACLSAEHFRQMYPEFSPWLKIKRAIDPHNYFRSALSKRLQITP